jgi:hypothetical protein
MFATHIADDPDVKTVTLPVRTSPCGNVSI